MLIGIDASRAGIRERTGTEAYAFYLIQALLEPARERRHHVRLYFREAPPDGLALTKGVEIVHIPFPRLWTHVRLAAELRRRPPDLFFTPAHVIPLSYAGPAVATVHDLGYHYFPEAHTRRQVAYLRWSTRHNARRSRRVIADSEATRRDLARFYDIDPARIDVVYPGNQPGLEPVTDAALLAATQAKYGVQPPYLLYLGTLQPRKNLVRLVEAYAASGIPHQLVLAGKRGWHASSILAAVNAQPPAVRERILLPGFVAEADKAALISGAMALLFPSLYEGFGFPVLEAQACGTAVVCADNSSLPEVAGEGALFVEAEDAKGIAQAIRHITSEDELRRALVEKGFENARRFTWQRAAEQVLDVLEAAGGHAG